MILEMNFILIKFHRINWKGTTILDILFLSSKQQEELKWWNFFGERINFNSIMFHYKNLKGTINIGYTVFVIATIRRTIMRTFVFERMNLRNEF